MGLGQKPVLSQQDQTQFYGNPCPPGCPFLRLLFPCRAGAAPLGSVPSTVLQFTVPLGCHIIPCLPSGPGYCMSQKQHTFPTLLKMAQTVDAVWQAAWQAAPCYFGAVWRDHGLYARVHSVHAKGAAGSSPAHCRAAWTKSAPAKSTAVASQTLCPSCHSSWAPARAAPQQRVLGSQL